MIAKKHTALTALAVCALALGGLGSVKNPVARPFQIQGQSILIGNVQDGTFVMQDSGEMTHVGRYTNHGSGTAYGLAGSGTATAANGDQLSWTYPGSSWYVQWTGGTGRFQNVSGGWNIVSSTQRITFPDPDTVVLIQTYTGVGTISY